MSTFGDNIGIGYDIGCSFSSTISHSSLGLIAKEKSLRLCVGAFHVYAHNHFCQLHYHPLYMKGFGLEDAETCERMFSSFNGLATITRYSSPFHWRQAIDLYARQWDDDKYEELCKLLSHRLAGFVSMLTQTIEPTFFWAIISRLIRFLKNFR